MHFKPYIQICCQYANISKKCVRLVKLLNIKLLYELDVL